MICQRTISHAHTRRDTPSPQARWRDLAWGFAPRWEDPPRPYSHHDYLLREMRWLANDMAQVRPCSPVLTLLCARLSQAQRAVHPAMPFCHLATRFACVPGMREPWCRASAERVRIPPCSCRQPQERLWHRHVAFKFAREAAAAGRARLERLAPAAQDAAAAAQKAAAAAHKAASSHAGGARGGSKRGGAAKQQKAAAAAAEGTPSEPSLVSGKRVTLSEEEKAALRADLASSEAAETAQAYGAWSQLGSCALKCSSARA